jgi:hypothetical protein
MAIPWTDFFAEIVLNLRAAWPEVQTSGGGGIHDVNHMERISIEKVLAFPYAVVDLAASPSAEWGITNSAFEVEAEIHYVAKLELDMMVLRTRLDALRHQFLRQTAFTTATCLDCTDLTLSTNDPALESFVRKNIAFIAGKCAFRFVLYETITDTAP